MKTGAWDSARSPIWPCRLEITGLSEQEAPVSSLQSTVQCGWGCPSCGFCWQMWQRCCCPGRTHLTLAASGENVDFFLEKKCWSHFNTCSFCCQVQYGVEHHVGEERGWDMFVFKHVLCSLIGGHIATLREFFIISRCCAANGRHGPLFFPPSRRQYHSSDLSPSPRLNVWKQDVLRLLALLGEAGMLIPRPRGARQYGAAWWPPASSGSRCHNTSCIASNQRRLPLPPHLHRCGRMSDSSSKQPLPRVLRAGWQQKLSFCCGQTTSYFLIKSVAAMLDG